MAQPLQRVSPDDRQDAKEERGPGLRQGLHQALPGSNLAKEWGGMSTAQAVAICSSSRSGADIWPGWMGGRV